ncbi:MAG: tRNA uridine-5-carboxymethylaminomethyl(34) synthesis GTPase MnmE [Parabacteroides sp.]
MSDTICAVSTAPGMGGIAVIRVSGPEAISLCDAIFYPARPDKRLASQPANTLTYGTIRKAGEVLDEVVMALFRAPHSFTGEDTVEITCHGSLYIQQQLLQLLVEQGCRGARPGEYTERAFLNGKMDLSQAEAVADLIASTSAGAHRLAMNQMRGGFSRELKSLRDQLLHLTSLMELELDFSDHEELEFADRGELSALAAQVEEVISRLSRSFQLGNVIKNGIPVAIVGETNAGKSTLLNALVGEERAIVSDIHGTTRDVIEDTVNLNGQLFRFIDTAGIRDTQDTIETLGIERTFQKLDQASIVLWLIDVTEAKWQYGSLAPKILPHCADKHLILIYNKADLLTGQEALVPADLPAGIPTLFMSAKTHAHLSDLQSLLIESAGLSSISSSDVIVTNVRHYEALIRALDSIHRVQEGLAAQLSGDFVSQDLRECLFHLSDIVGEVTTDQVLGNIFSHFCIGK